MAELGPGARTLPAFQRGSMLLVFKIRLSCGGITQTKGLSLTVHLVDHMPAHWILCEVATLNCQIATMTTSK